MSELADKEIAYVSWPAITLDRLQAYSRASGDPNKIHLSEEVAKKMGLPGIIAHGMLIAGMIAERAQSFAEEASEGWRLSGFQTRFKAMTFLGDVISVGGSVREAEEGSLSLELQARKQDGTVVCTALARFSRREIP